MPDMASLHGFIQQGAAVYSVVIRYRISGLANESPLH